MDILLSTGEGEGGRGRAVRPYFFIEFIECFIIAGVAGVIMQYCPVDTAL